MTSTSDHRSGGKMASLRRTRHHDTPYNRPNSSLVGPNWFSRFVPSPSRLIASGGKLLSSVFVSDSSSSSSSSSSLQYSDNEEDDDCENEGSGLDAGLPEKALSQKNDTKQLIAQLLLHESFSREECEWLTNIIRSRVVNALPVGSGEAGRLHSGGDGTDIKSSKLLDAAVMEARKWLEEKNAPNAKPDLQHGIGAVNCAVLKNDDEGDSTSPMYIAKSYMQARPPWASPSINHSELSSPMARQYSTTGGSLNLAKYKKASSASGSWNIHEEIRKVRSKATEELLRNSGSICVPLLALDYKHGADCLTAAKSAAGEDKMVSSVKPVDAIEREGSENMLGLQNGAVQNASVLSPGQKQFEEATHCNDNTEDSGVCHVHSLVESTVVEPVKSNGFPSLSSLSGKAAVEVNNIIGLELEKKQSEPEDTTDMANVSANDINAFQDSSVGQHDSENLEDENRKRKLGDNCVVVEKQPGRKMSKYNRRGRGKGK